MEFRVLGPLEVAEHERSLSLGGVKQRSLLAVQVYVSRLRKELGPGRPAGEKLREALGLWRGPALADLAYERCVQSEIARLEELQLVALEARIDADLATGRHAELIGALEALVADQPLRERLRCQLMVALFRSGRQAEALHALVEAGGSLRAGPVVVPLGAAPHDWAALELGTLVARATGAPLRLIGAASDQRTNGRDASRLLADASLIVQRRAGIVAEPLLASAGRNVIVLVRRRPAPGGLAPDETRTHFNWSLTDSGQ